MTPFPTRRDTGNTLELAPASPGRVERWVALAGMVVAASYAVLITLHNWPLTAVAPLGWRLEVLAPDALIGGVMAAGCGWVAFARRHQRVGWWITLVAFMVPIAMAML